MRAGWALVVLLLCGGIARAQTGTGAISGRVLDDEWAQGLGDVLVVAEGPAIEGTQATTSDVHGNYLLTGLPPGLYRLTAYGPAGKVLHQADVQVTVGHATALVLRFDLRPVDPEVALRKLHGMARGVAAFVARNRPHFKKPRVFVRHILDEKPGKHDLDKLPGPGR